MPAHGVYGASQVKTLRTRTGSSHAPRAATSTSTVEYGVRIEDEETKLTGVMTPVLTVELAPTFTRKLAPPVGTESISFGLWESAQGREFLRHDVLPKEKQLRYVRIFLMLVVGFFVGLQASFLDLGLHLLWDFRFLLNDSVVHGTSSLVLQGFVFVLFGVLFASASSLCVCKIAVMSQGSGIPEVKSYLNGIRQPGVLDPITAVAKWIGIVLSGSSGILAGNEGPNVHIGAIIGAFLCRRTMVGQSLNPQNFEVEARTAVAAGSAAGVAGAFGAPVGGVIFAVEELVSFMDPHVLLMMFIACFMSVLVMKVIMGFVKHNLGLGELGDPIPDYFGQFQDMHYNLYELPIFAVLGACCGLLGSTFNILNRNLIRWRRANGIAGVGLRRFLEVPAVTTFMNITRFMFLAGIMGWHASAEHEWTPMAEAFVAPMAKVSTGMFFEEVGTYDIGVLFLAFVMHYGFMILSNGLGMPMGLFIPSIAVGSIFGRVFGECLHGAGHGFADPGVYAILGAGGMMAGVARITLSMSVILMETTGGAPLALPLFISTLTARFVGDLLSRNVYDVAIVELNKVPLLEADPETALLSMKVKQVMSHELVTLDPVMSVQDLIGVLESCKHNGFPVLRHPSRELLGLAHRGQLQLLLHRGREHGLFQKDGANMLPFASFVSAQERNIPTLEVIRASLSLDELEMDIDIEAYLDKSGYVIPYHASVASCYSLFRKLGLRHLPVVGKHGVVVGIVTRKDLLLDEELVAHGAVHGVTTGNDGTQEKRNKIQLSEDSDEADPDSPHAGYRRSFTKQTQAFDEDLSFGVDDDEVSKAEATVAQSTARSANTTRTQTAKSKESRARPDTAAAAGPSMFGCLPRILGRQAAPTMI